jgi:hypothetical protein
MRILAFSLLLVGCSASTEGGNEAAAAGDVTATYRNPASGSTITVQVDDGGDSRVDVAGEVGRMVYAGGVSYVVYDLPGGPRTTRAADLEAVMRERSGPPLDTTGLPSMRMIERGEATIGDHKGAAFFVDTGVGLPPQPQIVMSSDPALAPLGAPILRQLDFSLAMIRAARGRVPETTLRVREVLARGTPLLYAGHRLERIDRSEIPAERFRLPGPPMSMAELRRNMQQLQGAAAPQ